MTSPQTERPALLGGAPIRPQGPPTWPPQDPATSEVLQKLAETGAWGRYFGPYTEELREKLGQFHDATHVRLCSSGTAAVELALRGVGIASSDEVVVAAYDFKANLQNVLALGARPVLVDIREDNAQVDVSQIKSAITPKTKAILVSHLHGGLIDMPALCEIAESRGVPVVEDACQATGAAVYGRPAGMWGDVGVLSFGGSKLLTAGRGGTLMTNRDDVAQRVKLFVERGNDLSPLSEMQAAVLLPQLEQLPTRTVVRNERASLLKTEIQSVEGLRPLSASDDAASVPAYYNLGFWYDADAWRGLSRQTFCRAMQAEGFAFDPGFSALHLTHHRKRFLAACELPVATAADARLVKLHHPILLEQKEQVLAAVSSLEKLRRSLDDLLAWDQSNSTEIKSEDGLFD
ncbi:aminotransferase class V-fold PLP-dependent enzyme [Calycomorphotria hydatis]|uniref:aminotransferase class V-fold PLP-dependent enzyme n=1 Tax=Calycomorphotria hydatis TaxID=2528027 RepID=UPI0018D23A19|nr:aminotransferase class V-fold PLP-dependent enzyme [Calycomorphotria hydatis]